MLSGATDILIDGFSDNLVLSTQGWKSRGIKEPPTETVVAMYSDNINDIFKLGDMIGYSAFIFVGALPMILLCITILRRKKYGKALPKKYFILFSLCLLVLNDRWISTEIEELSFAIAKGVEFLFGYLPTISDYQLSMTTAVKPIIEIKPVTP